MCETVHAFKKGYLVDNGKVIYKKTGNVRVLDFHKSKYPRFGFRYNGKICHCMVHRLVAYQKYGAKALNDGVVVRHRNDNPLDFSPENIVLGDQSKNMKDRWRNHRRRSLCSA